MKKRTIQLLFTVIALLATWSNANAQTATVADNDSKYATEMLKPGTVAPEFALQTPEGKTVKLSDYRGKYVVLDFWASWCPDCLKDVPNVKALYDTYNERGIVFVGVSFDVNKENWTAALAKYGIEYTQVSELKKWKETEVSKAYNIKWIPSLYLINPEGKVVIGTVMSEKIAAELGKISPMCEEQGDCCK